MINIKQLENEHIEALWEIIKEYPDYFNDSVCMNTVEDFKEWLKRDVIDCYVGIRNNEVIGCGYINSLHDGLAEINIFAKKHIIWVNSIIEALKGCLIAIASKHSLKMIYAIVRTDNKASIRLMRAVGFKFVDELKGYEKINGRVYDCIMGIVMKEDLSGGVMA